jgi:3-oxoacyl-[acyl-carrier protein] reductase
MSKLSGKIAVVTGASKGIGRGIAKGFAAEGASVVVNYASDRSGAEAVVADISKAGGKAIAVRADVSKTADAHSLIETAVRNFGRIDILVNNAGIYPLAPIESMDEEKFHQVFNVNVLGLLLVTQAALKHMRAGASIINIGSAITSALPPNSCVYTASKAAVDAITGVLAAELGPREIRVNALNPGFVKTEGTHASGLDGSDFEKYVLSITPLGRVGKPEDVASFAVFLASDSAAWVTRERIVVGGGVR